MNLLQLKYFITACETLNVTKAAEMLFISRPTISRALHELEDEFKVPLFNRTKIGLTLTKEGEYLYENVLKVQSLIESLEDHMEDSRENASTDAVYKINIGLTPLTSTLVFPNLYTDVQKNAPHFLLESRDCLRSETQSLLENGTIDFIITAGGRREYPGSNFTIIDLNKVYLVFNCSPEHRFAGREYVTLDDIKDEPLVQLSNTFSMESSIQALFANAGFNSDLKLYSEQISTINVLVEDALATNISANGLLQGNIVSIPIKPETYYTLGVVYCTSIQHNKGFDLFLEYLKEFKEKNFSN